MSSGLGSSLKTSCSPGTRPFEQVCAPSSAPAPANTSSRGAPCPQVPRPLKTPPALFAPELRRLSRTRPHPLRPAVPSPRLAAACPALPRPHLPLRPLPGSRPQLPHVPGGRRTQSRLTPAPAHSSWPLGCRSHEFQGPIGAAGCRSPALAGGGAGRSAGLSLVTSAWPRPRNCGGGAAGAGAGRGRGGGGRCSKDLGCARRGGRGREACLSLLSCFREHVLSGTA